MRIAPIQVHKISFASTKYAGASQYEHNFPGKDVFTKSANPPRGAVFNENGEVFNRSTTRIFRNDLNWKELREYLKGRFSEFNKVNTCLYACSSGEEPYSLSMTLQEEFGKKADKFFPIFAKDIDKDLIKKNTKAQNKGSQLIYFPHFMDGFLDMGSDINNFEKYAKRRGRDECIRIHENVMNKVQFSQANILEDIASIDSKIPTLLMCRNMWPYVDDSEYDAYAKSLYEKLAPGSTVVLGHYDFMNSRSSPIWGYTMADALKKHGFVPNESCRNQTYLPALIYEKN